MKAKMTARAKRFIEKRLIPFLLREHGRGFAMDEWVKHRPPGSSFYGDEVTRAVPKCGTVACIGGSVCYLKQLRKSATRKVAAAVGLEPDAAQGLFMEWQGGQTAEGFGWPETFAQAFAKAETPYRKAQVAVRLLRQVVKTEGACLDRKAD